jgi:hypothetical protein
LLAQYGQAKESAAGLPVGERGVVGLSGVVVGASPAGASGLGDFIILIIFDKNIDIGFFGQVC